MHPLNLSAPLSPPPVSYDDYSTDEYISGDEELSDDDLKLLNTDYQRQRALTFYPDLQRSRDQYISSSIDVRQNTGSAENLPRVSEKQNIEFHDWDRSLEAPPRTSSIGHYGMYGASHRGQEHRLTSHRNARAYQSRRRRRPLIDYIKNEWRHNPYSPSSSCSPLSPGYSRAPTWIQVLSAPRFTRSAFVVILVLFFMWGNWKTWARTRWNESALLSDSLTERMKTGEGWFGENMRPEFLDMIQVETLDEKLVPHSTDKNRIIVIGDVHGCNDELVSLLAEFQYEARTDHLIFTGDLVSKGPSSPAVVDLAIAAHASCVRGNHEDRVLLAHRDMSTQHTQLKKNQPLPPAPGVPVELDQQQTVLDEESFAHGDVVDRTLAKQLSKKHIDYLAKCPVILDLGQIKGLGNVHVVHGGLVAGVRLEKQDPVGVMNMRTVDLDTHVPSGSAKGTGWFKARESFPAVFPVLQHPTYVNVRLTAISVQLWNKYQTLLPLHLRATVIYGHDSHRGLHIDKYTKGIDTGCVKGGRLSALIIDKDTAVLEPKIVSIQCKDYRALEKEMIREANKMIS